MIDRFLVVRKGCPFCRQMLKVISKINLKLPLDKRIQIIDAWEWEQFGLDNQMILKKMNKIGLDDGFPFLYMEGVIIEPSPTTEQLRILLETYLNDEIII